MPVEASVGDTTEMSGKRWRVTSGAKETRRLPFCDKGRVFSFKMLFFIDKKILISIVKIIKKSISLKGIE